MKPLVTVGIPAHNEEKYIAESIESVLRQSFENFILIISENCSDDETYQIAKEYAEQDKRILLIRQKQKMGAPANFKFLYDNSQTKYFMWLGGHDILCVDFIKHAVEAHESDASVSLVYPLVKRIDKDGSFIENLMRPDDELDTTSLNMIDGAITVARNTRACCAIHGLIRKNKSNPPFRTMIGSDHLIIFHFAMFGKIKRIEYTGLYFRYVREEDPGQLKKRYIEEGVMHDIKYPYAHHALNYFMYILKNNNIGPVMKLRLIKNIKNVLGEKFNVRWKEIIYTYFFNYSKL